MAGFVRALAPKLAVAPTNASVKLVDGKVVKQKAKNGRVLDVKASTRALAKGLRGNARKVKLVTRPVAPEITNDKLGKTIEINLSTNRLTFYDGLKVRKVYRVATGQPSFPTPQGTWEVVYKRVNPTWTNPAPDGWGADMPKSIPPGPGNPLGTRAMSLNARDPDPRHLRQLLDRQLRLPRLHPHAAVGGRGPLPAGARGHPGPHPPLADRLCRSGG